MLHEDIHRMLEDKRGVSPVIGVILMVAVTVVLAALIGAFVFGLGDDLGASAPNVQIDFSYSGSSDELTVTHAGGQSITTENTGALFATGSFSDGSVSESDGSTDNWGSDLEYSTNRNDRATVSSSLSAGSVIMEDVEVGSGETLELQWESPNGDQTATLGSFSAP